MLNLMKQSKVDLPPSARTYVLLFLMENKPNSDLCNKMLLKMRSDCENNVKERQDLMLAEGGDGDETNANTNMSNLRNKTTIPKSITSVRDCAILSHAIQSLPIYTVLSPSFRPVSGKKVVTDVKTPYMSVNGRTLMEVVIIDIRRYM